MSNFTALIPSGSTDGRPIKVVATSTPGTTVHTATSAAGMESVDEVFVWAVNTRANGIFGTLHIGTVTDDEQSINFRVPGGYAGPTLILPGVRLRNGVVLTATASVANRVNLIVNVNRVSAQ